MICNTTLISNFALVGRLDLLPPALGRSLFTTTEVIDEISAGVRAGYKHLIDVEALLVSGTSPFRTLALEPTELATLQEIRLRLHAGEASCLAIALHRGLVLGTDDLAARKIARKRAGPVIGTVGALVLCRRGLLTLDQANDILRRLISLGYRSPVSRLDSLWK